MTQTDKEHLRQIYFYGFETWGEITAGQYYNVYYLGTLVLNLHKGIGRTTISNIEARMAARLRSIEEIAIEWRLIDE